MLGNYTIDFFELMFLAESVIPPKAIARTVCFINFSEKAYHIMNDTERKMFFEHVTRQPTFNLSNKDCAHFYARFNPDNQYKVTSLAENQSIDNFCYIFNGKYHINESIYIPEEYILNVVKK